MTEPQAEEQQHNTQPAFEIAAFEAAYAAVEAARKRTDVLAADIGRHLNSLRDGDDVRRTSETQAALSTEGIETIIDTLLEVRDALLVVLVVPVKVEADGEFEGLSEDDTAGERQLLGMRLRADMGGGLMKLKPEQVKEVQDAVDAALNNMLPQFVGSDIKSMLTTAMEASIGHVDFPDGRTASITIRVEIETAEGAD